MKIHSPEKMNTADVWKHETVFVFGRYRKTVFYGMRKKYPLSKIKLANKKEGIKTIVFWREMKKKFLE